MKTFKAFLNDEEAQDLTEYALLLAFIALVTITILPALGSTISSVFVHSNSSMGGS